MRSDYSKINSLIPLPDAKAGAETKRRWDSVAKPLNGLGQFENLIIKAGALTGTDNVDISKRAVVVFCADNGVVAEGVTQTDASVTATMAGRILNRQSSVCRMSAVAGADVFPVDMGMVTRVPGVEGPHLADGTDNFTLGPAMTESDTDAAIRYGISLVKKYKELGYKILVTGEMGIGNTTTSSAIASVLLWLPVEEVTGRGAGLSDEGLTRKINAIRKGIKVNLPDPSDPFDVLMKLGGFDIAGMTGMFIGGAMYGVPIVIDGLISSISALIAARLCPRCTAAMIPSHSSAEPAARAISAELGVNPIIYAGMKLGEGTGGVCMLPILDMALAVYNDAVGFSAAGVGQYINLGGDER